MASGAQSLSRQHFIRRGLRLEYLTLGWNSLEAVIAVVAGLTAGSIALVGFGFDSVVECLSGAVLVWRLRTDAELHRRERVEAVALRLVGVSFLILGAYVAWEAIATLIEREAPEHSPPGIALAIASLIVMPLLARAKRTVAKSISSNAMHADSRQTDICAYLSAILLGGLVLNAALGWWWADPLAALIMTPIILKEGVDAIRGKNCGCEWPLAESGCTDGCHE
ncbi:MAG TPA: cation transporter [Terriglobales bacterium]|nr:cation transporter [Terriglobales bacterium]